MLAGVDSAPPEKLADPEEPWPEDFKVNANDDEMIQARIAQLVAYRLGTGEVLGSNPGKGDNFSVKKK